MIMSDSNISEEDFDDSELEQTGYFSIAGGRDFLYLFIETLTGTSFEMRVSPMETVVAVKAKLQQLEGIPVNQQHLLFNNQELPNNSTLSDCDVPDGATLKLVLAMRGGPINTRKVPISEDAAREIQEAVERNKDDLLGQIPEGGHVTVLVFRDGDDINLYHVVERPDGSYSPLSDSWSGSSIRNLFAEPDDPDVQQRIQENANTMSKMQDLRSRMESMNLERARAQKPSMASTSESSLPPIHCQAHRPSSWTDRDREMTTITELGNTKHKKNTRSNALQNRFPEMEHSRRKSKPNLVFGKPVPQRPSVHHQPGLERQASNSRMISLDIGELKKNVDNNDGFNPSRRSHRRAQSTRAQRRRASQSPRVEDNDIFVRNHSAVPREIPSFLSSSNNIKSRPTVALPSSLDQKLHKSLVENDLRRHHRQRRYSEKSFRSEPDIKKVMEDQVNGNQVNDIKVPFTDLVQTQEASRPLEDAPPAYTSMSSTLGTSSPGPRGLERRLLNSRRGKLTRTVAMPRILASPKGSSSPRTPRQTDTKHGRASYPTRPLSGPRTGYTTRPYSGAKKKKSSKPRCRVPDCNKKLTITNSFSCRCGDSFCPKHRHPETHACSFDFKSEGRKILEANNPIISMPKLPKI